MLDRLSRAIRIAASKRSRTVLSWLLCICVWRGPIPVIHQHSLEITGEVLANCENVYLLRHILTYHSCGATKSTPGWHVHFLMPRDLLPFSSAADCTNGDSFHVSNWVGIDGCPLLCSLESTKYTELQFRQLPYGLKLVSLHHNSASRWKNSFDRPPGFLHVGLLKSGTHAILGVALC